MNRFEVCILSEVKCNAKWYAKEPKPFLKKLSKPRLKATDSEKKKKIKRGFVM